MSPYTSATPVPAGVTVTPAPGPPIRTLSANNISVRFYPKYQVKIILNFVKTLPT